MLSRSLPLKINAAIVTTGVAISILFVSILYPLELRRGEEQIKRINTLLHTVFNQKINDLANELFAKQERALRATLDDIREVDDIVGIDVYDENGKLFLSSDKPLDGFPFLQDIEITVTGQIFKTASIDGRHLAVYANIINVIGKKIGYVVIYHDLSTLKNESRKAITIIFILPIATVLLMAVLLNFFLFRSIIKPVSILHGAMREVESGKLGETVSLPAEDEIGAMGAAFNDMSSKLQTSHEALIEAEEKYRSIFENAIEGVFQYSVVKKVFITVNPSMARMLGYSAPQELIRSSRQGGRSFFASASDFYEFDEALQKFGQIIGFETRFLTKNGEDIWVSLSARRVFDEQGAALYDEGSFIDITEHQQRKAEEQKRVAAESASRAKSDFLATMSHEIRTPLNAILGFADILEGSLQDEKQKNYLGIIRSSGTNLLSLINDILDLSKIEAGKMEIRRSAADIRALMDELLNLFSATAAQKKIALRARVDEVVPAYLLLDIVRLRQVLFNLIGNGVKFTEEGGVEIHCLAENSDESGLWNLSISVEDTGPGIEEDALQLIFHAFHQHGAQESSNEGTGLGLAITKNLIEMMNGRIDVQSRPGQGTIFTVTLEDIQAVPLGEGNHTLIPEAMTRTERIRFAPALLLVVDDLEINRRHIITALINFPLDIVEAENGKDALAKVATYKPDAILMDIRMPEVDGYEASRRIREEYGDKIPIIAITAAGMKEDIARIGEAGFNDHLIRPFHRWQLIDKLSNHLEHTTPYPRENLNGSAETIKDTALQTGSVQQWECSVLLGETLQGRVYESWKKICRKQRIPDIIEFAEELYALGKQHSSSTLIDYAVTVKDHAENVEIDKLQSSLAKYQELLDLMIMI